MMMDDQEYQQNFSLNQEAARDCNHHFSRQKEATCSSIQREMVWKKVSLVPVSIIAVVAISIVLNYNVDFVQAWTSNSITATKFKNQKYNQIPYLQDYIHRPFVVVSTRTSTLWMAKVKSSTKAGNDVPSSSFQQVSETENNSSLSNEEIALLLKKRSQARRKQDFQVADEILKDLKQHGVSVHDPTKMWRADGKTSFHEVEGDNDRVRTQIGRKNKGPPSQKLYQYTRSPWSKEIPLEEEKFIVSRIEDRSRAKLERDFDKADDIRDELRYMHNIVIDDNSKIYNRIDPNMEDTYEFGGKRLDNVPEDKLLAIQKLMTQRIQAKKKRDYNTADSILKTLEYDYGVSVNDKKKKWHFGRGRSNNHPDQYDTSSSEDNLNRRKPAASVSKQKMTEEEARAFTVKDLRGILRNNGLTVAGTKDKLILRLIKKGIILRNKKNCGNNNIPFFLEEGGSKSDTSKVPSGNPEENFFATLSIPDGISIVDETVADSIPDGISIVEEKVADSIPDGISIVEETVVDSIPDGISIVEEITNDVDESSDVASLPNLSFDELNVKELKEKLRDANLTVGGNKAELVQRLINAQKEKVTTPSNDNSKKKSSKVDLEKMTVPQLKEILRDANLPVGGRKADLIERLRAQK